MSAVPELSRAELARRLAESIGRARFSREGAIGQMTAVVCERAPEAFAAAFVSALTKARTVFVANPDWDAARRAIFEKLVSRQSLPPPEGIPADAAYLCLPTGGSGGGVKLARHDADSLAAAAGGFARHFSVGRVNAVGVLPLHHVSGLMAWVRCALSGGRYVAADWTALAGGRRPALGTGDGAWFISLVPTQLARLLKNAEALDWLRGFHAILLGGGPAWPALLEEAAGEKLPIAFSYGSTESAAMVAALRPDEFQAGRRDSGTALPHVRLSLADDARLQIGASSLFRGYWPGWRTGTTWVTDDRARIDAQGRLTILGRADAFIVTGGEKVDPVAVEKILREIGDWPDLLVVGVPDADWGQRVVACYPAASGPWHAPADFEPKLIARLTPAERPKAFIPVAPWPRDAKGKIDPVILRRILEQLAAHPSGPTERSR